MELAVVVAGLYIVGSAYVIYRAVKSTKDTTKKSRTTFYADPKLKTQQHEDMIEKKEKIDGLHGLPKWKITWKDGSVSHVYSNTEPKYMGD